MPSKSGKQHRLMEFIAHGGSVNGGPSKAVAQGFVQADKGHRFVPRPKRERK